MNSFIDVHENYELKIERSKETNKRENEWTETNLFEIFFNSILAWAVLSPLSCFILAIISYQYRWLLLNAPLLVWRMRTAFVSRYLFRELKKKEKEEKPCTLNNSVVNFVPLPQCVGFVWANHLAQSEKLVQVLMNWLL